MPYRSRVRELSPDLGRLTDRYFVVQAQTWVPRVIADETLPKRLYAAGKTYGWSLRSRLDTQLPFEIGEAAILLENV